MAVSALPLAGIGKLIDVASALDLGTPLARIGRVAVAITGASGVIYGLRLLEVLGGLGAYRIAVYTDRAAEVAGHELGLSPREFTARLADLSEELYSHDDFRSPLASSSGGVDALVVVPCSIKTLSGIVHGFSDNLVVRGALSMLRLRRPLVLVPRETPLGVTELELMRAAAARGAVILPASPGFYHRPEGIEDLVDFVVGKILDVLGLEHDLYGRWPPG